MSISSPWLTWDPGSHCCLFFMEPGLGGVLLLRGLQGWVGVKNPEFFLSVTIRETYSLEERGDPCAGDLVEEQ